MKLRTQSKYRQQSGSALVVGVDVLTELLLQPAGTAAPPVLRLFAVQPVSLQTWGMSAMPAEASNEPGVCMLIWDLTPGQTCTDTYLVSEPAMQKLTGLQTMTGRKACHKQLSESK